jgi:hypothetical protein
VGGCFFLFSISFSSVPTPGINNEHSLTFMNSILHVLFMSFVYSYGLKFASYSIPVGNSMVSSAIWKKTMHEWVSKLSKLAFEKLTSVYVFQIARETILYYLLIIYMEKVMQSLLKTPKCFFLLFLLEIAVSYWLSLLLFHILSQSERKA